jgi:hypothetical protein
MILSKKHGFLFLKTKKTASTSLEIALTQLCGDGDIITPIAPDDEVLRFCLTNKCAQNFCEDGALEQAYRTAAMAADKDSLGKIWGDVRAASRFYNHMTYDEIIGADGVELGNDFFVFTIERRPDERILSLIGYRRRHSNAWARDMGRLKLALHVFLRAPLTSSRNSKIYTHKGKSVLDSVIRFDQMNEDIKSVLHQNCISEIPIIPRAKVAPKSSPSKRHSLSFLERAWVNFWARDEYDIVRSLHTPDVWR